MSEGWQPPAGADPDAWPAAQPAPTPPPGAAPQWRNPQPPPGYFVPGGQAPPAQAYFAPGAPTSGKATAALVLGICGIVVLPFVCSIIALVLGYQSRREIDNSGGAIGGRGNAVAGIVLGWIGVAIGILIVGGIILIALADPTTFDPNDDAPFSVLRALR